MVPGTARGLGRTSRGLSGTPHALAETEFALSGTPREAAGTARVASRTARGAVGTLDSVPRTPRGLTKIEFLRCRTPRELAGTPRDVSRAPRDVSRTPRDVSRIYFFGSDARASLGERKVTQPPPAWTAETAFRDGRRLFQTFLDLSPALSPRGLLERPARGSDFVALALEHTRHSGTMFYAGLVCPVERGVGLDVRVHFFNRALTRATRNGSYFAPSDASRSATSSAFNVKSSAGGMRLTFAFSRLVITLV